MTNQIYVDVSARHIHLKAEDAEVLFGPDFELTPRADFNRFEQASAYEERVAIVGPNNHINNVTILGPFRDYTQVEISKTDAIKLGIDASVKISGDIEHTPGCQIIGPYGTLTLETGVIVAKRHIHISYDKAEVLQISKDDLVGIEVEGNERSLVFNDVVVRTHHEVPATMHIDTDEANAGGITSGAIGIILKR